MFIRVTSLILLFLCFELYSESIFYTKLYHDVNIKIFFWGWFDQHLEVLFYFEMILRNGINGGFPEPSQWAEIAQQRKHAHKAFEKIFVCWVKTFTTTQMMKQCCAVPCWGAQLSVTLPEWKKRAGGFQQKETSPKIFWKVVQKIGTTTKTEIIKKN